jgi:hypothetical protein
MTRPQDRFVHQNRPLAEWLLQLVDADAARRRSAADVITNRFFLALDQIPPAVFNEAKRSQDLFAAEVRRVVNTPDFPAADFVRRLLSLDLALQESWMETIRAQRERDHEPEPREVNDNGSGPRLGYRFARKRALACRRPAACDDGNASQATHGVRRDRAHGPRRTCVL